MLESVHTHISTDKSPLEVPYFSFKKTPIDIKLGRQLFVDDYLIEKTTMNRVFHSPKIHPSSPILEPQTPLELNSGHCPVAAPFNDGVWFDPKDNLFKMWYQAGWFDGTALATSSDGLKWDRPELDIIPGTNAVISPPNGALRDGGLVWLDHFAEPSERFKLFLYFRDNPSKDSYKFNQNDTIDAAGHLYASADGIHWNHLGLSSACGDNTTFFYNPFKKRFVFSIRESWPSGERASLGPESHYRARSYHENESFLQAGQWEEGNQVKWARADCLDRADPTIGDTAQLYDLNANAYESLMIGAFAIFYGPQNPICAKTGSPKIIDIQIAFSRDGFHWDRNNRTPFIKSSREDGTWNYGYLHASGGICLIVRDELWFYFSAFSGKGSTLSKGETGNFRQDNSMYSGGSTGLAILRRDGFASMEAGAKEEVLVTKPVLFEGNDMYVNVDNPEGELKIEILDINGKIIPPYTIENCQLINTNNTKVKVLWSNGENLSKLIGLQVKFRFKMKSGKLYSFWVSSSKHGASNGFTAAGGPGLSGPIDNN